MNNRIVCFHRCEVSSADLAGLSMMKILTRSRARVHAFGWATDINSNGYNLESRRR